MLRKVRIVKSAPKARTGYQVQGSLANDVPAFGGADYNAYIGAPKPQVSKTMKAVPRQIANLEAEGGETVVGNLDGSKMPSFKTIVGPRHSSGGVPLLLPEDSFIFSDTKAMKIADPKILDMFGVKPKKGGYTPAELSKKYDINNYRKILQDPNSDKISRTTAEIMIKNYVMKLGALALAQESKKAFPQGVPLIARPYMESMGLTDEDLIPELAMQQEQQMPQQEVEEVEEEFPQTMPDGQPIAQPQPMPQQMPEPGMAPMAQYGMTMGGYDMPFYDLPEAEYGMPMGTGMSQNYMGNPRYTNGGNLLFAQDGVETVSGISAKPVGQFSQGEGWQKGKTEQSGYDAQYRRKQGEAVRYHSGSRMGTEESVAQGICAKINKSGNVEEAILQAFPAYLKGKRPGMPGYEEAMKAAVARLSANPLYADCIKTSQSKFQEAEYVKKDEPPQDDCPCLDKAGKAIPGVFAKKDKDGNCLKETCESSCECVRKDGSKYTVEKDINGDCKDCEEEEDGGGEDMDLKTQPREAEWWLQDTVNAAGAFGDLMGIRKRMPWEPRVDLEEPRPTFLDPTRELAAQSEQANIAAQASAQFAGPQALGARLSAIQGQGAAQAANTLSQINNQNVNIANQFEGQQVGIRNQEQLMNQQLAGRLYDKNTIADQQFQNAKRAGRANMAQAYNTAVTNKWKTDALNQMYQDYQVGPASGGRVEVRAQAKDSVATKPKMTVEEYVKANQGQDPRVLDRMLQLEYGQKYGGATMFRNGGYTYAVFPYGDY
jgi:hypothetical protein